MRGLPCCCELQTGSMWPILGSLEIKMGESPSEDQPEFQDLASL